MKFFKKPIAASALAFGLTFGLSSKNFAADWPQFLGPARNGVAGETNVDLSARAWPVAWQVKIGQGFAGPVVSHGRVILFHRIGNKEIVEMFAATNGLSLWKTEYPATYRDDFGFDEGPRATPALQQDSVVTMGAIGVIQCLDFASGRKRWAVDAKKEFGAGKGFFGMACSPLMDGDRAVFNVGGASGAGTIALELRDGSLAWKSMDDEASYSSPILLGTGSNRRLLLFSRSGLFVLDPGSGAIKSRFPWRSPIHASVNAASPIAVGDEILLSASYDTGAVLLKLEKDQLKKLWSSDDAISAHYSTPVAVDGSVFGFHGRQDIPPGPALRCIEWKTGKIKWSQEGLGAGSILAAGSTLLILTEKGELIAAPASSNKFNPVKRQQVLGFEARAMPALADGFFFARNKNTLVAIQVAERAK